MTALVVAANRGPATINVGADGGLTVAQAAGGLAPSLARAVEASGGTFVAASMTEGDRRAARDGLPAALSAIDLCFVEASETTQRAAIGVVANRTLWFLHHGLFDLPRRPLFDRRFHEAFQAYREYNRAFAEAIAERADEGATVVVHDYQLSLVGATLAAERPDLKTVHFTHTPFCTPDELAVLPVAIARELLGALSSFGACGFHTTRWAARFRACAAEFGYSPETFAVGLGTDAEALTGLAASDEVAARISDLETRLDGRKLLLRSDRLELSKNLLRGFLAYEELLLAEPQWRSKVTFVARVYASRSDLAEYLAYRREAELLVERVNERFATADWTPISLEVADDYLASVAALCRYDALLVNPVRDGMNLVAKEGPVLNGRAGMLALSREAGAFEELGADAVAVEPFDVTGTARSIAAALSMPEHERRARGRRLASRAAERPPSGWHELVIEKARRPRRQVVG